MKTWERGIKQIEQGEKDYWEGCSKPTETELRWALLGVIETLYEIERALREYPAAGYASFYIQRAMESLIKAGNATRRELEREGLRNG
jgi:hypothetical protein